MNFHVSHFFIRVQYFRKLFILPPCIHCCWNVNLSSRPHNFKWENFSGRTKFNSTRKRIRRSPAPAFLKTNSQFFLKKLSSNSSASSKISSEKSVWEFLLSEFLDIRFFRKTPHKTFGHCYGTLDRRPFQITSIHDVSIAIVGGTVFET